MKLIYDAVQILMCIFEVYMLFDFFAAFLSLKGVWNNRFKKNGMLLGLSLCIYGINSLDSSVINIVSMIILYFLMIFFSFNGSILKKILYYIIANVIMGASEGLFAILYSISSSYTVAQLPAHFIYIGLIGTKLLAFTLFNVVKRISKSSNKKMDIKTLMMYTIVPVSWLGIILAIAYSDIDFESLRGVHILAIGSVILGTIGNVLIFYAFDRNALYMEKVQQQELMITKLEMEENYYEQIDYINQEHATLLHDIHHYLKTIGEVAQENKDEDVLKLLSELQIKTSETENIVYSENRILNAVLNEKKKYGKSVETDIKINVEAGFFMQQIDDMDLIAILGNLLDNAIEASEKCKDGYVKVHLFMQNDNHYSVIKIQNNYTGEIITKEDVIVTSKEDKKRHGIGIKNVIDIVGKYGGSLQNFYENNVFTAVVLLPTGHTIT